MMLSGCGITLKEASPKPERRHRRYIDVDEAKTKLGKEQLTVWAARGADSKELLAIRVSFIGSSLDAEPSPQGCPSTL